jgi:Rod binding domain-containing protein
MPASLIAALGTAGSGATAVASAKQTLSHEKIKAVSNDFESVFLNNMLEEMFAGVGEDDPFGNTEGAATWRSLQVEEFGRAISRAGGIGLAAHVERQLLALQESKS